MIVSVVWLHSSGFSPPLLYYIFSTKFILNLFVWECALLQKAAKVTTISTQKLRQIPKKMQQDSAGCEKKCPIYCQEKLSSIIPTFIKNRRKQTKIKYIFGLNGWVFFEPSTIHSKLLKCFHFRFPSGSTCSLKLQVNQIVDVKVHSGWTSILDDRMKWSVSPTEWCDYSERFLVSSIDDRPGVEVRENRLFEFCIGESEKMAHVFSIIKSYFTSSVVQVDPHPSRGLWRVDQAVVQVGACFILACAVASVPQHQSPETILRTEADLLLPVDGGVGHPKAPRRLAAHLHLPVVSARGEGFRAQDDVVAREAFGVIGQVGLDFSHVDTGATGRHPQAGVGRVRVKGHLGNDWTESKNNWVKMSFQMAL